jgi:hypothetical protein
MLVKRIATSSVFPIERAKNFSDRLEQAFMSGKEVGKII